MISLNIEELLSYVLQYCSAVESFPKPYSDDICLQTVPSFCDMRIHLVGKRTRITMADEHDFESLSLEYVKSFYSTAFDRYKNKLKWCNGAEQIPDPYGISVGWAKDLELWPDVTYGDIFVYLIETPGL